MNRAARILALSLVLAAFPAAGPAQNKVLTDDFGHVYTLPDRAPRRVVSLAPNITEILFAVGAGDQVVGVTRYCDHPPEALEKDRIGGFIDPSVEMILKLNPDLVIAFRGNPIRTLERIRTLGLPVFVFDIGNDLAGLPRLIERVGLLAGRGKRAAVLAAETEEALAAASRRLAERPEKPSVFLALNARGLWTCGRNSYLDDILRRAGGRNIAGDIDRDWVHFSRERLFSDNPDAIVILSASAEDFRTARDRLSREYRLGELRAFREGRVYYLDENTASRFGPRLIQTLNALTACLHPDPRDEGDRR